MCETKLKRNDVMNEIENLEGEIWCEIKDFEGLYQVSNMGRVKSLKREVLGKMNSTRIIFEKLLSDRDNGKGYRVLELYKDSKRYFKKVHRLVAEAFIPNPENKPEVNHIDTDKTNNCVTNLEWVTGKENSKHIYDAGKKPMPNLNKKVYQLDEYGNIIATYDSAKEAAIAVGGSKSEQVACVARGDKKSFKGTYWKYATK
jgi:hypothetical protein